MDGYRRTGCINLICAGFVQTSSVIALGSTFTNVSKLHGPQFQINLRIDHVMQLFLSQAIQGHDASNKYFYNSYGYKLLDNKVIAVNVIAN